MATCSSILAWEIPWTEEPGWLQSMGSQRVGHNLATENVHVQGIFVFLIIFEKIIVASTKEQLWQVND